MTTNEQDVTFRTYMQTGRSLKQTASMLNLSYNAVKKRIARYRKHHPESFEDDSSSCESKSDPQVTVEGIFPDDHDPDPEEVWERLEEEQNRVEQYVEAKYSQRIVVDTDRPIAIAPIADLHFGNKYCDYRRARRDVELVRNTPGMYAGIFGDCSDNWIGRLEWIQRHQPCEFDAEVKLVEHFLELLSDSTLVMVAGNHDNRTKHLAGLDYIRKILKGAEILYDSDEVCFTLQVGDASWRVKTRHKWPGRSIYNPTHGEERDARFGDWDWDIAIGGHDHRGTLFRDFVHGGRIKHAVMVGSYLFWDRYAAELNLPGAVPGTGAMIFYPDGRITMERSLDTAAEFLKWQRSEA